MTPHPLHLHPSQPLSNTTAGGGSAQAFTMARACRHMRWALSLEWLRTHAHWHWHRARGSARTQAVHAGGECRGRERRGGVTTAHTRAHTWPRPRISSDPPIQILLVGASDDHALLPLQFPTQWGTPLFPLSTNIHSCNSYQCRAGVP